MELKLDKKPVSPDKTYLCGEQMQVQLKDATWMNESFMKVECNLNGFGGYACGVFNRVGFDSDRVQTRFSLRSTSWGLLWVQISEFDSSLFKLKYLDWFELDLFYENVLNP